MSDPPTVSRGLGGRRQLILLRAKTLSGGYLGSFVRVCPRVQSVEHGQLRVIDHVNGVVESVGRILLCPMGQLPRPWRPAGRPAFRPLP